LMLCNSGIAQWKNFVPVSYCRATLELLSGVRIMGIHPRKPKHATFMQSTICERLWVACTEAVATIDNRAGGKMDWKRPYIVYDKLLLNPRLGGIGVFSTFLCTFCELLMAYTWISLPTAYLALWAEMTQTTM
jgi:hypothetical protein